MYAILFYADIKLIVLLAVLAMLLTGFAAVKFRAVFKVIIPFVVIISLFLIIYNTVLGRQSSDAHQFLLIANYNSGFWREMLMNALLFFPLGLSIPYMLNSYKYSILIAFIVSLAIETWQYLAGTGVAQGTDVIMNILGVAIGGLSYVWSQRHKCELPR